MEYAISIIKSFSDFTLLSRILICC